MGTCCMLGSVAPQESWSVMRSRCFEPRRLHNPVPGACCCRSAELDCAALPLSLVCMGPSIHCDVDPSASCRLQTAHTHLAVLTSPTTLAWHRDTQVFSACPASVAVCLANAELTACCTVKVQLWFTQGSAPMVCEPQKHVKVSHVYHTQ